MNGITKQALRFGAVGLLNTGLGLFTIWLFMWLGSSPILSNAIGYGVGMVSSFGLNRSWSFARQDKESAARNAMSDIPKFLVAFFSAWLLNITVVSFGLYATDMSPYLLQIFGLVTYTVAFFVFCRVWVFAR